MERAHAINLSWLLRLRWGAVAGQVAIIALVDRGMGIDLPLLPLAAIVGVEVASNVVCARWAGRVSDVGERVIGSVMMLDVLLLTALLYLTGGPFNPFSFLYLVNIALAAVVLRPAWTWALVAFSLACFGVLFLKHVPLVAAPGGVESHGPMWMHLQGMWVAFGVAAGFIVYFIQRVRRALAEQEAALAAARSRTARSERLASLATLAAGAAHELATPLSTIAVVARELERQLEGGPREAVADARLIRRQVERCREILLQLAADAGAATGEAIVPIVLDELLETARQGVAEPGRVRVTIDAGARTRALHAPPRALARILTGVLKNACQASAPGAEIEVRVGADQHRWSLEVRDRGAGMTPEVLARAGEPFFTTKNGNGAAGMGLGLFLARAVLERLEGSLELDSAPGKGTTARLLLPVRPSATIRRAAAPASP